MYRKALSISSSENDFAFPFQVTTDE